MAASRSAPPSSARPPDRVGESSEALLARAAALREAGRVPEAIVAYERLLALRPELAESWYNLGWLRRRAGLHQAALDAYGEALRRGVSGPEEVRLNRAAILADHFGRSDDARTELEAALALNARFVPALLNLGNLHEDRGRRAEARSAYERALAAEPGNRLALARLAGVAEIAGAGDPIVGRLRQALSSARDPGDRADLGFALGRVLDAAGAYDEAWAAFGDANRASRAATGARYDRAAHQALIDRIVAAFPGPKPAVDAGSQAPVFICGMFRSGSTLAEQVLARHRRVTPGGELDLLPALIDESLRPYPETAAAAGPELIAELRQSYLQRLGAVHPDADIVTDKRPDNFLHIGLIKALFPDAKIVHTRREPLDNILSVWFLHLDPAMAYALDVDDAAHWYRQYRRLMAHWRRLWPEDIFDLDYDALIADPRPTAAALLEFCGLEWDEACLSFHEADNPVRTASAWQVREPLYRRSSGRWRNYRRHLGPLREALAGL